MNITDILPFLIPLAIAQIALFILALRHILTHEQYKLGNRTLWIIVVFIGMQFIGPILYFLLGREDS